MKLYLKEKSSVTESEFLFLARYVILLAFLTYQKENEDALTADVMLGEEKLKKFLSMLKKGSDSVWELVSFLPQDLVDELTSDEFLQMCKAEFAELDKDKSGSLEPKELMPVILSITEVHKFALSERHCSRFVDIFDTDKNGVISSAEFADFVRFMVIMAFLETEEGQSVSLSAEAKKSSKSVDQLLDQLSSDRKNIHKVLPMLPDAVYERLTSDKFIRQCREQFERLDEEKIGLLKPYELHQVIVEMTSAQPFAVSEAQCLRFTQIFDHSGDGLLSPDEFLDFARFLSVLSYLQSDEGKAACREALTVMDDAKKIEDLINELKTDKQKLAQVMPYLPSEFKKELLSDHFTNECISFFRELDQDNSGSLDPQELFPVILSLADVHKLALDIEQCQRFANIFDENGDRLIGLDEFVTFSRFIIVLSYLHSKDGGELMLDAWDEDTRLARPDAPEPPMVNVPSDLPTELDAQELSTANVPADEHLAVDCEFYKNKSDKLSLENQHLRERMNTLEELIRKMQVAMEEQEHKLLHAQVDLRASTASLR
jgi:Ca2+-binding EF-hand superfamily protein